MAKTQTEALLGLFTGPDEIADALDALRAAGFAGRDLEVLSDTPFPAGAFGEDPDPHRLYVFPLIGGLIGLALGLLLTIGTQMTYPLVTGGKPILSIPPMINVIFETTMLGAVILTVLGMLFEARLPDWRAVPRDRRISEGYLGVLVTRTGGRPDVVERVLREAGAVDIVGRESERDGLGPE